MPETVTSTSSPTSMGPTPSGVPVRITSPGSSVITEAMTLLPGDVILTGTPAGVGPLNVGDEVAVTIEGIGTLTNKVIKRG